MIAKNYPCVYEKHDVGCESRRFHQDAAKSAKRSNGAKPTLLNDKRQQDTKMLGVNFSNIAYGSARFGPHEDSNARISGERAYSSTSESMP
jgi:hypothetical protein